MDTKNERLNMNNSNNNGHRGLTWANVEPWDESVDAAALFGELREVFRNYVGLPKWAPEMLALWTVHTYAFQLREVTSAASRRWRPPKEGHLHSSTIRGGLGGDLVIPWSLGRGHWSFPPSGPGRPLTASNPHFDQ